MTIMIVDYSLEIVIAIIIYDRHNLHWMMFILLFEATTCHFLDVNNKLKNTNWKTARGDTAKGNYNIRLDCFLKKKS